MLTIEEALEYLSNEDVVLDKDYWEKANDVVKNLNYLIIKCANKIKALNDELSEK